MSQWAGIRHLHLCSPARRKRRRSGSGARRRPRTSTSGERSWDRRARSCRPAAPPRPPEERSTTAVAPRVIARPAPRGRTTGWPEDGVRWPPTGRGQLLAGGHHAVGLRVPRDAVQPARLADHGRGLRGGRLRALPQRSRRRGRPDRRCRAAAHRDAEPGRVRARSAPGHRAAGDRARAPHRAAARRPASSRPTWTDGWGATSPGRLSSACRTGWRIRSGATTCTSPTIGAPTSWRARGTVLIVGSCCRSSETDSSVRAPAAPAGIRGV